MRFATLSICMLLFGVSGHVSAETVFNSLDGPFAGGFSPDEPTQRLAQQFLLGDNRTVTSATVGLGGTGSPTGTMILEIWNDSGSGTPGESVGMLGSIDIATVNTSGGGGEHTVDSPVPGLTPDEPYYLVMSYQDIFMDNSNHTIWGGTERTAQLASTNGGALEGMVTDPFTGDWITMRNYPTGGPPFPVYHFASINAVPEPSTTVLVVGATCLLMLAWRKKRGCHLVGHLNNGRSAFTRQESIRHGGSPSEPTKDPVRLRSRCGAIFAEAGIS